MRNKLFFCILAMIMLFLPLIARVENINLKKGETENCFDSPHYLHIHYISTNGDYIELSNGKLYKISPSEYTNILTWSYSDALAFYREGVFIWGGLMLRNETRKESIGLSLCK